MVVRKMLCGVSTVLTLCLFFLLRRDIRYGDRARFLGIPYVKVSKNSRLILGNSFMCNSGICNCFDNGGRSKIDVREGAVLRIGNHSGMSNTVISCHNHITIGNYVNIGAGCIIMDTDFHSLNWKDRENRIVDCSKAKTAPIFIGDYAFIGCRSIICKGVEIGEKSIVAAGSVVVNSIPPNCIAGGNPCKVLKLLSNE